MKQSEKIEVFGSWVFVDCPGNGIIPWAFYPFMAETAASILLEQANLGDPETVTIVEDLFTL